MSSDPPASPQGESKIPLCRDGVCTDCPRDTDVIFESTDGFHLAGHAKLFESYGGFKPAGLEGGASQELEIVKMPHSLQVLRLLFRFMHHDQPQPDIKLVDNDTLKALVDAVHMHEVFPAIQVCKLQIEFKTLLDHPLDAFVYAAKYDHVDILDKAAIHTIDTPFKKMRKLITSSNRDKILYAWFQYREEWLLLQQAARKEPKSVQHKKNSGCDPSNWSKFYSEVLKAFGDVLSTLSNAQNIITKHENLLGDCEKCHLRANYLKGELKGVEWLPSFSDFLNYSEEPQVAATQDFGWGSGWD